MIAKWVLGLIGLHIPMIRHDQEVARAMQHASEASSRHRTITSRAASAALTIVDLQDMDKRPAQMMRDADQTRRTMEAMLGKMK